MQAITIELTEEEHERWTALSEEQQTLPQLAFIRALNYRWRLKQSGIPVDFAAFDAWPPIGDSAPLATSAVSIMVSLAGAPWGTRITHQSGDGGKLLIEVPDIDPSTSTAG